MSGAGNTLLYAVGRRFPYSIPSDNPKPTGFSNLPGPPESLVAGSDPGDPRESCVRLPWPQDDRVWNGEITNRTEPYLAKHTVLSQENGAIGWKALLRFAHNADTKPDIRHIPAFQGTYRNEVDEHQKSAEPRLRSVGQDPTAV